MSAHPVPFAALDGKVGILGITGSGKTHTAIGLVELLLEAGRQVIIIDPTGAYKGLRTAFPIPIYGGNAGDVPIREEDGDAVARLIVQRQESAIVDVSLLLKESHASARRFMAAFVATLKNSPTAARYLVMDEADEFMPEGANGSVARLFGDLKWIVRRGRIEGWRVMMVTQRPADIAKSVFTQCETLVIHQLTAPQDRRALDEWVKGNATPEQAKEVLESMASLETGEAWIWSPKQKLLVRGKMPANRSADSSKTPDADDAPQSRVKFRPVDVKALVTGLLQAGAQPPPAPQDVIQISTVLAADTSILEAQLADARQMAVQAEEERASLARRVQHLEWRIQRAASVLTMGLFADYKGTIDYRMLELEPDIPARRGGAPRGDEGQSREERRPPLPRSEKPQLARQAEPQGVTDGESTATVRSVVAPPGTAKVLAVIAQMQGIGIDRTLLALRSGIKARGSTMSSYLSRLRSAGMIEEDGDKFFATPLGRAAAGPAELPPAPGPDLARFWAGKVPGVTAVVDYLIRWHPGWTSRADLAERVGINAKGSSLSSYISRLRSAKMIEERGQELRLSPCSYGRRMRQKIFDYQIIRARAMRAEACRSETS